MLRRNLSLATLAGFLLLTVFAGASAPPFQVDEPQFFPEKGHGVRPPFVAFFKQTGGVARYGFPITNDYVDPETGLLVQYFEKARLELHPGNPDPYRIQLGLLGEQLSKRTPPIPVSQIPAANDPNCQHFFETGHNICMKFREHWLQHGGLDMYGYPISEFTIENGRIVQYFQRARMEWHPEKPEGQRVQLGPLGFEYYHYARLDVARLQPDAIGLGLSEAGKPAVTALRARGSVLSGVTSEGSTQTGFVYVSDQLGNPIGGAAVTLKIHYPSGDLAVTLPPTGAKGTTFGTFMVGQVNPGTIVSMDFVVNYPGLSTETRTSFMVWFN